MARNFRSLFRWITPAWLHTGEGEKVLHALSTIIDASTERVRQGLLARFPSRTGGAALGLHGIGRGLVRGRIETDAHFAARLKRWRYPRGHRVRGSAFALLEQVWQYWGSAPCTTRDAGGAEYGRTEAGVEYVVRGNAWDWDYEPDTSWARFWLTIDLTGIASANPELDDPALWGGDLGTPGATIGSVGVTPQDVAAIRRLLTWRPWKPAGTRSEWAVIHTAPMAVFPNPTWFRWSKNVGGHQVAAREASYRYWSLCPEDNNTYGGDAINFPVDCIMPGGGIYGGDDTSFPLSVTLPDGTAYGGAATSFPRAVLLLDDGDMPQ